MKKALLVILALVLAFSALGCTEKKEETANNDLFTDQYFEGLEQMTLLGMDLLLTGEEMQPVVEILQGLSLSALPEGATVEENMTPVLLMLTYEDGTMRTVQISDTMLSFTEVGAQKYCTSDQFFADFIKAFGVGEA